MKLSKSHGYHRFITWTKGLLRENPVLSLGLALPFAAAAVSSLQTAAALSVGVLITLLPTVVLMSLLGERIPALMRLPACALMASLFLLPTRIVVANISVTVLDSIGIYFSLLCVSTLLFAEVEWARKEKNLLHITLHVLCRWLGFSLAVVLIGLIREILGSGTVWGHPLTWMRIRFSGVLVTGAGLILLGFSSAIGKKIHRTILYLIPHRDPSVPGFFHLMLERNVSEDKNEDQKEDVTPEQLPDASPERDVSQPTEQPSRQPALEQEQAGVDEVEQLLDEVAQSREEHKQPQSSQPDEERVPCEHPKKDRPDKAKSASAEGSKPRQPGPKQSGQGSAKSKSKKKRGKGKKQQ